MISGTPVSLVIMPAVQINVMRFKPGQTKHSGGGRRGNNIQLDLFPDTTRGNNGRRSGPVCYLGERFPIEI